MNAFEPWVMANEPLIRMGFFFGVFSLVALWELASPRRALKLTRQQRWTANLGIVLLNTVIVRLLFPAAAVGMAALGVEKGWGLLNNYAVPFWLAVPLAVVAMDFVIWLQHVMVHAVPALWRLHRVHHADLDYDLTTGARFHPLEIVLSMGIKFATIALLGAPVLAVVIFEVLLSACATFNHGNIRLPAAVDRALRWEELGEEAEGAPVRDSEFVLSHCDNIQASGFLEHIKLPHYVDFQSELELVRRLRAEASSKTAPAADHVEAAE